MAMNSGCCALCPAPTAPTAAIEAKTAIRGSRALAGDLAMVAESLRNTVAAVEGFIQ